MLLTWSTLSHFVLNLHKSTLWPRVSLNFLLFLITTAAMAVTPVCFERLITSQDGRSAGFEAAEFHSLVIPSASPDRPVLLVAEALHSTRFEAALSLTLFTDDCRQAGTIPPTSHLDGRLVRRIQQPGNYHLAVTQSEPGSIHVRSWLVEASSTGTVPAGDRIQNVSEDEPPKPPREPIDEWDIRLERLDSSAQRTALNGSFSTRVAIQTAQQGEEEPKPPREPIDEWDGNSHSRRGWVEIPGYGLLELGMSPYGITRRDYRWCRVQEARATLTCAQRLEIRRSSTLVLAVDSGEFLDLNLPRNAWLAVDADLALFDTQGRFHGIRSATAPFHLAAGRYYLHFKNAEALNVALAIELE